MNPIVVVAAAWILIFIVLAMFDSYIKGNKR